MKHSILLLAGCALAVIPLGAEETPREGTKSPPRGEGPRGDGSLFREADKDKDHAISKEEAGDRWERLSKLDKDNDGKVTGEEFLAGRAAGPGGPGREGPGKGGPGKGRPGALFERADTNQDGKLTEDEVPAEAWARLSKLDKNEDGSVTPEEARAGAPGRPDSPGDGGPGKGRGGEFFERADKNGDGKLSQDEVPEQAWERLSQRDKDKDGAVSKEELAGAFAGTRGGPGGKGRGAGGPDGGPGAMFSRFDEDQDGKLTESEVPGEMWSKLRRADTDADGTVSRDELGKVYSERDGGNGPPRKKPEEKKTDA